MKELLYIIVVPMTSVVGLAAFSNWWSALAFISGIAVFAALAVRRHEKHHRSEVFDDRLSAERVQKARDWLVENWVKTKLLCLQLPGFETGYAIYAV